jgi:hypothetical protein
MAINVEAIGEKILALLQGYGYQVQSYSKEGELVWPDTDGIMPEATRFVVAKPNLIVRLSINDNSIILNTSEKLSEHPIRKQLMQLADNFLLNFDYQVFNKKITPAGEKFDIAQNAEKDMSDVMGEAMETNELRKLAGLPEVEIPVVEAEEIEETESEKTCKDCGEVIIFPAKGKASSRICDKCADKKVDEEASSPKKCSKCKGAGRRNVPKGTEGRDSRGHVKCDKCDGKGFPAIEEEVVAESSLSRMKGTKKTSHQTLETVKLIVKHKTAVNEESRGSRSRNIHSIYIQRGGERFKMQENNLTAARAMARHMNNGGEMHDATGAQIVSLAEDYKKLREFVSYVRRAKIVNESNEEYVALAKEGVSSIKSIFTQMSRAKGYSNAITAMEAFANSSQVLTDDIDVDIESTFTETHFDNKIANAMEQIKGLVGKQHSFRESITKAVESETFDGIRNLIQETDIVGYDSPRGQLAHQVSQMGNAATNEQLGGFLRGAAQKISDGGGLNQFEYGTIKSCLMSVNEPKLKESKAESKVMEQYEEFLGDFILT